ncbi:CAP domain-containing protein [Streptomyces sp. NPDC005728]|uniref:CAP domain-containing protein n=1 Tax=Streptomyces sp. NPDC005728 TaxID=3157054 RepID=UPI0033F05D8B
MGRHRRSAAGRAATGRATGVTHAHGSVTGGEDPQDSYAGDRSPMGIAPYLNPEAYAESNARSTAYLYSVDGESGPAASGGSGFTPDGGPSHDHRRRKKAAKPVRTGLLGVSAAVALGTVAVATGVMPGLENYQLGGSTSTTGADRVQAADSPSNTAAEQGGTSGRADTPGGGASTSSGAGHSTSPSTPSPSASPSASASASASGSASSAPAKAPSKKPKPAATAAKPTHAPKHRATKAPKAGSAPVTVSAQAAAEAEVLKLVNEERAKVGCSALAANSSLTGLAEAFSDDMAARGFFDHTDPDGATPWDRAAKAGITDLGGENIARGQADAAAVMEAWMNSPGHRANILNCDFKTLGVGVHLGPGGPWWTQDFGY